MNSNYITRNDSYIRLADISADFWEKLLRYGLPEEFKEKPIINADDFEYHKLSHQPIEKLAEDEKFREFRQILYNYILARLTIDSTYFRLRTDYDPEEVLRTMLDMAGLNKFNCHIPFKAVFRIFDKKITYHQRTMDEEAVLIKWKNKTELFV